MTNMDWKKRSQYLKKYWLWAILILLILMCNLASFSLGYDLNLLIDFHGWLNESQWGRKIEPFYINSIWFWPLILGIVMAFWSASSPKKKLAVKIYYPIQLIIFFLNAQGTRGGLLAWFVFFTEWLLVGFILAVIWSRQEIQKNSRGMDQQEIPPEECPSNNEKNELPESDKIVLSAIPKYEASVKNTVSKLYWLLFLGFLLIVSSDLYLLTASSLANLLSQSRWLVPVLRVGGKDL